MRPIEPETALFPAPPLPKELVFGDSVCCASVGARVITTSRAESDKEIASRAGAEEVFLTGDKLVERIRAKAPDGVHHVVEVAFGANNKTDTKVLALGGSIATYATNVPMAETPVWQLVL